jgi:hypothetical protein
VTLDRRFLVTLADDLEIDPSAWEDLSDEEVLDLLDLEQVERVASDTLDDLSSLAAAYPMAVMPLWVDELDPCDQRRQVISGASHTLTLTGGGNRGGKTLGALMLDVALALGRDHPMIAAWLALNDINPMLIPAGPGDVYVIARSAAKSRDGVRKELAKLLPSTGVSWNGRDALAPAFVRIKCPGYDEPAIIYFGSEDQGHEAYKGGKGRRYHLDEEPSGNEGKLILEECLRGASTSGGNVTISATPQYGRSWVTDELMIKGERGCVYTKIDCLGNYLIPNYQALVHFIESCPTKDEQRMRRFGDVVERGGLVYPMFTRGDGTRFGMGHVCDPFEVPLDWPRFRAADVGLVNATAIGTFAVGDDGTVYLYRERYGPVKDPATGVTLPITYEEHARGVHEDEGRELVDEGGKKRWRPKKGRPVERIYQSWSDPSGQDAMSIWRGMELYFVNAMRKHDEGYSRVMEFMALRGDNRPRFKIFSTCVHSIRSIEGLSRDPSTGHVIKKDDHAADMIRYGLNGIASWFNW